MVWSVALLIHSKVLTAQLDGLIVLRLLLKNESDAAEMPKPKNTAFVLSKVNLEGSKGKRTCVLYQQQTGAQGRGSLLRF